MSTKIDYNSSINQDIKGKFIAREVFCNVNSLVQAIIDKDENAEMWEEWENYECYTCPLCGDQQSQHGHFGNETESDHEFHCNACDGLFNNPEPEPEYREIMEYWAVDNHLYEKLKEMGHPVWDSGSTKVWGRCTSGQAILLDLAISEICESMEILDGQINSWKDK